MNLLVVELVEYEQVGRAIKLMNDRAVQSLKTPLKCRRIRFRRLTHKFDPFVAQLILYQSVPFTIFFSLWCILVNTSSAVVKKTSSPKAIRVPTQVLLYH